MTLVAKQEHTSVSTSQFWPQKSREFRNHHFDSSIWNDFVFRNDDIIIATYAKSGTTWVQQIIGQLLFGGEADVPVASISPWLDLRVPSKETKLALVHSQTHRRFLKTHLPTDALVFSPRAKYVYVGRDGRDVVWSLHHHHSTANSAWYKALNETPGLVGPLIDRPDPCVRQYFHKWMKDDGFPFWPFWENVASWWAVRALPNVCLLHFNDLKMDLPGQIRRLAAFLQIPIEPAKWPAIVLHCGFDYMKRHATKTVPLEGAFWDGGSTTFINRGTNGRWRDVLSSAERRAYETRARHELGTECAAWLENGRMFQGDKERCNTSFAELGRRGRPSCQLDGYRASTQTVRAQLDLHTRIRGQ